VSKKIPATKEVKKVVKAVVKEATAKPRKKFASNPTVIAAARKKYRNSAKLPKVRKLARNLQVSE
jgi:hypothetical protein